MHRFRTTFSPSTAIAALALFVSLGGTGYAAASLSGSQLTPRSVPGDRIKLNALTGKEILESSLGRVPTAGSAKTAGNAARLGGLAPSSFTQGGGRVFNTSNALLPGSNEIDLLDIAQIGSLRGSCDGGDGQPTLHLDNANAASHDVSVVVHASNLGQTAYFGAPIGAGTTIKAADQVWDLQGGAASGTPRTISLRATAFSRDGRCHFLISGEGTLQISVPPVI